MNRTTLSPAPVHALSTDRFRSDVIRGLEQEHKRLDSRYFYDAEGDRIFQRIMQAPEYYLTRAENEILRDLGDEILQALVGDARTFDLYELGAGDGTKTRHLMQRALDQDRVPFYRPIDISGHVMQELTTTLQRSLPQLEMEPVVAEYFDALRKLPHEGKRPKAILFLGSSIGNLERRNAVALMAQVFDRLGPHDRLLIGFDLKKQPETILRAYDDAAGHTRAFNLNLLRRINRELGADFHLERFIHAPVYDPASGRALSYLVSTCEQVVRIPGAAQPFHFRAWEAVHTETSQKYDQALIQDMAHAAGGRITDTFSDPQRRYSVVVLASA
jgi:dimethylhistidine N-methyltransferase